MLLKLAPLVLFCLTQDSDAESRGKLRETVIRQLRDNPPMDPDYLLFRGYGPKVIPALIGLAATPPKYARDGLSRVQFVLHLMALLQRKWFYVRITDDDLTTFKESILRNSGAGLGALPLVGSPRDVEEVLAKLEPPPIRWESPYVGILSLVPGKKTEDILQAMREKDGPKWAKPRIEWALNTGLPFVSKWTNADKETRSQMFKDLLTGTSAYKTRDTPVDGRAFDPPSLAIHLALRDNATYLIPSLKDVMKARHKEASDRKGWTMARRERCASLVYALYRLGGEYSKEDREIARYFYSKAELPEVE